MNEVMLIPRLRFKEFSDKWEMMRMGNIIDFQSGNAFKSFKMSNSFGKHQLIKMSNVYKNELRLDRNPSFWDNLQEKNKKFLLNKGDTVLTLTGTVGKKDYGYSINIPANNKYLLNQRLVRLRRIKGLSVNSFINYTLKTDKFLYNFFNESKGGTGNQTNVGIDDIKNIKTAFPKFLEQQKIAAFLASVDEKITQLQEKKTLLEQYKKGVMQQIFSQELRFKNDDGSNYADWEEKKLGDIGTFQTSSVDKLLKEDEKEVFLVNYMNVYRHEEINSSTIKNLNIVTAKDTQIVSNNLKKGDILFTPSSETTTDIGHSVVIFEDLENTLYSYHLLRFRPKIKIDILYSHYFCNNQKVLKQLSRLANGSTRFTISTGNFSKVLVELPSLEEQTKIANFLSAIDTKIEFVHTQLEDTQQFKKGLLQQMFV
jgi:type I restriction enzyme S subunit